MSEFDHPKHYELEKYLKEAMDSWDSYTPSQCINISREIWYLKGGRDEVQTSLSHLWVVARDCPLGQVCILIANNVVTLLLPELSHHDLLDKYLKAAISIHEEYNSCHF